ncbi:MAG: PEGA domain-containing protein [Spirochaetales bacterium]|nr:PEGA domain-containing protein [Spirochaetales bacterium]
MLKKKALVFVIMLMVFVCSLNAELLTGLQIQTPMPNMKIYVDGTYAGETQSSVTGIYYLRVPLAPGSYTIRCEHPDISSVSEVVEVPNTEGYKRHIVNITSKPVTATGINTQKTTQTIKTGSLKVISIPSGATIRVDNQALSVPTDASVSDVSIGKHTVSVSFPSLSPLQISVMLEAGQTITVTADFENMSIRPDATYNLNISSVPSEAKVTVDEEEVGVTPVTLKLSQGVHNLSVVKDGYKQYQEKLNVESHDFKKIELQEVGAQIKFIADGADASIPNIDSTTNYYTWRSTYYIPSGRHFFNYGSYSHQYDFQNMHDYEITIRPLLTFQAKSLYTMDNLPGKKAMPAEPTYKQDWKYKTVPEIRADDTYYMVGTTVGMVLGLIIAASSDMSTGAGVGTTLGTTLFGALVGYLIAPKETHYINTSEKITLEVVRTENRELRENWERECNGVLAYNEELLRKTNLRIEEENRANFPVNDDRGFMIIKDLSHNLVTSFRIMDQPLNPYAP